MPIDKVTGETKEFITGFLNEPLDLDCSKRRKADKDDVVTRRLRKNDSPQFKEFVSSRWEQGNYTKHCNEEHSLYELCSSQVTSYVTNNQVTHFVIKSAPRYLNDYKTYCDYHGSTSRLQIIKLQGRIKGYVNRRIDMKCHVSYKCNESESVTLKFNTVEVKTVDVNHANSGFPCKENEVSQKNYYNVCHDHMNSSYVNGSCSVIFVFERTPVSLNNTHLYCHVKIRDVEVENYVANEAIIFLQYQQNDGSVTTATPLTGTTLPGTTPTTAPNTTTSSNETKTTPTAKEKKSSSSLLWLLLLLLVLLVVVAIIVCCYYRSKLRSCYDNVCRRMSRNNNGPKPVWV